MSGIDCCEGDVFGGRGGGSFCLFYESLLRIVSKILLGDIVWSSFTYIGKKTTYITNIFKHSNIRITYGTNNTLQNHLGQTTQNVDKFSLSGVYKLTCPDCKKAYIGQTGRVP